MSNNKILGLLGLATKAGKVISGTDIVIENIKSKKINLIVLASDSSEKTKKNFVYMCEQYNIRYIICSEIYELSKAIGKGNRAVLGVKDKNFAEQIYKIYGGEVVGEN